MNKIVWGIYFFVMMHGVSAASAAASSSTSRSKRLDDLIQRKAALEKERSAQTIEKRKLEREYSALVYSSRAATDKTVRRKVKELHQDIVNHNLLVKNMNQTLHTIKRCIAFHLQYGSGVDVSGIDSSSSFTPDRVLFLTRAKRRREMSHAVAQVCASYQKPITVDFGHEGRTCTVRYGKDLEFLKSGNVIPKILKAGSKRERS